jgi:sugar lactone lactonase YvrE
VLLGIVTTLAGQTSIGSADGTGALASFNRPFGVAVIPSSGVIVVGDGLNNRIRLVTYLGGVVTTLAGSTAGFADGTGPAATFRFPYGVAVIPSSGVIAVADSSNHRIRLVTQAGVVTTLAGSGSPAFVDGTGAGASFNYPHGVAVIPSTGDIVVADTYNNRIRLVTPAGVVTTLAGQTGSGFADGTGSAARFYQPQGVAVIPSTNVIVVGDTLNDRIRLVTYPGGVVTTLAGSTAGFLDGTGAAARLSSPVGLTVDANGNIIVADSLNNRIRMITPAGVVTTLAGQTTAGFADGTGSAASFSTPQGVAVTSTGDVIVADFSNNRIRVIV